MRLKLVLRGTKRPIYTPGRPVVASELDKALEEIQRSSPSFAHRLLAALRLVSDGCDPRDVAEGCTTLGEAFHWTFGNHRVSWFWGEAGRFIVVEAWRKKGNKERRERIEALNNVVRRYRSEVNEYYD